MTFFVSCSIIMTFCQPLCVSLLCFKYAHQFYAINPHFFMQFTSLHPWEYPSGQQGSHTGLGRMSYSRTLFNFFIFIGGPYQVALRGNCSWQAPGNHMVDQGLNLGQSPDRVYARKIIQLCAISPAPLTFFKFESLHSVNQRSARNELKYSVLTAEIVQEVKFYTIRDPLSTTRSSF